MTRKANSSPARGQSADQGQGHLYTLEVCLLSGPITERFAKKNPVVSRTIQIRGDQTLADLHHAIFDAFGRWEEHLYEFQFGKRPMDPQGPRYGVSDPFGAQDRNSDAESVGRVTLESLGLTVGRSFAYWFDFGDDWWHQIDVVAIDDKVPAGKFPKVTKRVGRSPPQYADE